MVLRPEQESLGQKPSLVLKFKKPDRQLVKSSGLLKPNCSLSHYLVNQLNRQFIIALLKKSMCNFNDSTSDLVHTQH